jgi:hypothetical protein
MQPKSIPVNSRKRTKNLSTAEKHANLKKTKPNEPKNHQNSNSRHSDISYHVCKYFWNQVPDPEQH